MTGAPDATRSGDRPQQQADDIAWPELPPGMRIFGCVLRDRLVERVRAGDRAAFEMLLPAIQQDLPAALRIETRDEQIRGMATVLRSAVPGISTHRLAHLLADAGATLDRGGQAAARELRILTAEERGRIERAILEVLEWLPARPDGTRWLRWRQISEIIQMPFAASAP